LRKSATAVEVEALARLGPAVEAVAEVVAVAEVLDAGVVVVAVLRVTALEVFEL
jgi:hypothetical protein